MLLPDLAELAEFLERLLTFALELGWKKVSENARSITANGPTGLNPLYSALKKMMIG